MTHQHRGDRRRGPAWLAPALMVIAGLGVAGLALPEAEARPRPQASSFAANKTLGAGIMFGVPTGFSGKLYLGADTAVDLGLGVVRGFRRDGLYVHIDFLWHPATLVSTAPFELPLYIGLGGRLVDLDDDIGDPNDDDFVLGVRGPVGIIFDFNTVPLDVFIELALVLDVAGYDAPSGEIDGAVGVRYYFY
ncbi:hypothetical protein [Haliangium sp.]|uniref:hypothetical protein n=1 Tax=Haliangium sp. TaxID=2663208 RepID=UPI003D1052A4